MTGTWARSSGTYATTNGKAYNYTFTGSGPDVGHTATIIWALPPRQRYELKVDGVHQAYVPTPAIGQGVVAGL